MRDTVPMRAAVFGSWSHQGSDGRLFFGEGRATKLGAEAEWPPPWWRRTAAERAAADCVAAEPSAARAHAPLRWARPLRGAQLPEACSLACASFEYTLRRSGCETAWGQARERQGEGRARSEWPHAALVASGGGLGLASGVGLGLGILLLLCARACVCAAHLGPRLDEATVEVVEGHHRVHQLAHLGLGRRFEELAREPLEWLLAVPLVQHLHVHVHVRVHVHVHVHVRVHVRVHVHVHVRVHVRVRVRVRVHVHVHVHVHVRVLQRAEKDRIAAVQHDVRLHRVLNQRIQRSTAAAESKLQVHYYYHRYYSCYYQHYH